MLKNYDFLKKHADEKIVAIKGYEARYLISSYGRFFSLKYRHANKIVEIDPVPIIDKRRNSKTHYLKARLSMNGKRKSIGIHRLVAIAFIPNPDKKNQVNHIDGNKSNNHVKNLEWSTQSENQLHAFKNGLNSRAGDRHNRKKITSEIAKKIKLCISEGNLNSIQIAKKFKTTKHIVRDIKRGKTWRDA